MGKIRDLRESIVDWYFEPKWFERSGRFYETLGVKLFSRYCVNGGSYWSRSDPALRVVAGRKDLSSYLQHTGKMEATHLLISMSCASVVALGIAFDNLLVAEVAGFNTLLCNCHPIMSQRYNRNRAVKLAERLANRS